jgi:hypothetical protein
MNTLTNKPTVQLFALYSEPRSTNIVMLRTNNQVFEEVNISEKEVIDALNPATNNNVDLGKSRDINLGFMVLGDGIADGVQVQLLTPWVDDGGNITGESRWWRDAGRVQLMDSQTHTFTYTHSMMCSMDVPVNPWTSVPIPTLHIPDNYTNNVLYTIWRVDSKSTHEEYIKVAFHLH